MARLALDRSLHGNRLGSQLLASALMRTAVGARDLGGRYVVVDAIDDAAASFYRHHGFDQMRAVPTDSFCRSRRSTLISLRRARRGRRDGPAVRGDPPCVARPVGCEPARDA
ncbi:MAG: hypothetical protein ACRDZ8_19930 [Acidimicrobiales bacterium]